MFKNLKKKRKHENKNFESFYDFSKKRDAQEIKNLQMVHWFNKFV